MQSPIRLCALTLTAAAATTLSGVAATTFGRAAATSFGGAAATTISGTAATASPSIPSAAVPAHLGARDIARHGASAQLAGRRRAHARGRQQSLNWAGYIRKGRRLTSAAATWRVPTLASTPAGYSSTWVGIDGAVSGDRYLIQIGTEADVLASGRRVYHAWWEVITPDDMAPEYLFRNLVIRPGDMITASVRKTRSGPWTMRLRNVTTKRAASKTVSFSGPGSSAEWIQEDTDVNGYISPAPNWGKVAFTTLKLNGRNPKLRSREAVDIVDKHGTREAATSAPTRAGSGFTVTWLAGGTSTATS